MGRRGREPGVGFHSRRRKRFHGWWLRKWWFQGGHFRGTGEEGEEPRHDYRCGRGERLMGASEVVGMAFHRLPASSGDARSRTAMSHWVRQMLATINIA